MTEVHDDGSAWRAPERLRDPTVVPWASVKDLGDPDRFAAQVAAEVDRLPRRAGPKPVGRHRKRHRFVWVAQPAGWQDGHR